MVSYTTVIGLVVCVLATSIHQTQALPPPGFGGPAFNPAGLSSGVSSAGGNPWMPSWIANAPWMPKWATCDYTKQPGSSCQDCNTKIICTLFGSGIERRCTDPTLPHCNLGQCSATPSAECAPATVISVVPAAQAA